ncbi:MAG: DEAD/DEAH box helicase [Muribaculaceae bacterium]|nr:DEAD/DEAH box helicase [Muribaculaceae bacterium]
MRFDELDLSDDILDALDAMQFSECTPIQEQAIPAVLEGRDLIAVAQTGTGKTAAFLLPVIDRLASQPEPDAINCVVMSPTRELAQQIDRQMEGFSYFLPVSSVAIYGGTDGATFAQQQRGLKMGADVVIATPGRLLAHMSMGYVDLSKVQVLILDEADRMLDMGFYDDIMQIVSATPASRQTLMFSATMPPKIKQMAQKILNNPAEVKIAVSRPADSIDQSVVICHERQKTPVLRHLFEVKSSKRVIVFAASKLKVKDLNRELRRAGYKSAEMHSDLEQDRRDEVMHDFRAGRIDILVATDILARGIDIDDIALVVNYDVPREAEDYVHRIGRTARAGMEGSAVTLVGERDRRAFASIEQFLGKPVRREELPAEFGPMPELSSEGSRADRDRADRRGGRGGRKRGGRNNHKKSDHKPAAPAVASAAAAESTAPSPQSAESSAAPAKKRRHRGGRRHKKGGKPSAPAAE